MIPHLDILGVALVLWWAIHLSSNNKNHHHNHKMDPFLIRDVLPAACRPVHYDLQLTPNLTSFKFQGSVQIHLEIKEATNRISVNAAELELGLVELRWAKEPVVLV